MKTRGCDCGQGYVDLLLRSVRDCSQRYNWKNLPPSFMQGAVTKLRTELRVYFDGMDSHVITARIKRSKAQTFEQIEQAIISLRPL